MGIWGFRINCKRFLGFLVEHVFLGERFSIAIPKWIQKCILEIGSVSMFHFAVQYCELRDETTCIGKRTLSSFICVKNQLATRSGSLCGGKSLYMFLIWFPWPQKCSKRSKTYVLSIAFPNLLFSGTRKSFAILWCNITNYGMKRYALERARTQLSDA